MNEVVAGIYVGGRSQQSGAERSWNNTYIERRSKLRTDLSKGIAILAYYHLIRQPESTVFNAILFLPKDFVYKVISIEDSPEENIMQYFPECNEFIHKCLQGGGKILIHCIAGQSRSSALAAAYIMQERKIGADEALALIKLKRPQIYPNSGFKEQLELYYELDYKVSTDNSLYRHFLISKNSELFAAGGSIDNVVCAADPAKSGNTSNGDYRCKMCRRSLLRDENVLKHSPGAGQLAFTYKKQNRDLIANSVCNG
ncbi:tyrosine protein phosphatase yvh1 [Mycoemilia scoparia]|uniref:protein-tyrosine-phosphatase n=1 Tax=Mycoemilia scoparia TaxID=417184 RepID=A0A9W8A673_9FUNG|nr:tyrosine protein phosphatase yvh1 [Mycoemilia scoparia]